MYNFNQLPLSAGAIRPPSTRLASGFLNFHSFNFLALAPSVSKVVQSFASFGVAIDNDYNQNIATSTAKFGTASRLVRW